MCQNLHPTPELNRSPSTHTPGESGARAAVLGFRPAVREAAQRNTQVAVTAVSGGGRGSSNESPSSENASSASTLGVSSGSFGGRKSAKAQDYGGKQWSQLRYGWASCGWIDYRAFWIFYRGLFMWQTEGSSMHHTCKTQWRLCFINPPPLFDFLAGVHV